MALLPGWTALGGTSRRYISPSGENVSRRQYANRVVRASGVAENLSQAQRNRDIQRGITAKLGTAERKQQRERATETIRAARQGFSVPGRAMGSGPDRGIEPGDGRSNVQYQVTPDVIRESTRGPFSKDGSRYSREVAAQFYGFESYRQFRAAQQSDAYQQLAAAWATKHGQSPEEVVKLGSDFNARYGKARMEGYDSSPDGEWYSLWDELDMLDEIDTPY